MKQSYRNRCYIYGPNGRQSLVIPVEHENLFRIPISEVKISYESRWNHIHWKSLCTAYRNSPYFEYFEDDFQNIYLNPPKLLFDFNLALLKMILKIFQIKKEIHFSESFEKDTNAEDFRNHFHPKKNIAEIPEYYQVFKERFGFINDLSCIDLLFNAGPDALKSAHG